MTETFKLATVSSAGSRPFVSLVLNGTSAGLEAVGRHAGVRLATDSMLALLAEWDESFDKLSKVAAFLGREGLDNPRWRDAVAPIAQRAVFSKM